MFDIAVMPLSLRSNCAIIIAMPAAAMIYTKLLRQASQNFTLSVLPQIIATIINKSHMRTDVCKRKRIYTKNPNITAGAIKKSGRSV